MKYFRVGLISVLFKNKTGKVDHLLLSDILVHDCIVFGKSLLVYLYASSILVNQKFKMSLCPEITLKAIT